VGRIIKRSEGAAIARQLMHAAETLREVFAKSGLTQAELAARMGVTPARVNQLMSGNENPTIAAMTRFIEACGFRWGFLITEPATRKSEP
jgi:transcriptional regulator with XRE-family HTH domain